MTQTQPKTCPGKTYLRVVGIIMIVFSSLAIIMSLITLFAGGVTTIGLSAITSSDPNAALQLETAMVEAGVTTSDVQAFGFVAIIASVVTLLSSIFTLIVGILGTKNANRPEKAKTLFVLGIICLVFAALPLFSGVTWSNIVGLVLPVLYVIGASMNRKAA